MKSLIALAFLVVTLVPLQPAQSNRTVSLDDLVGIYKPSSDVVPWIKIEKSFNGLDIDIFILSGDLKFKTKILSSASGYFRDAPVWLGPFDSVPTVGDLSTQSVTTPAGFVLVQSQSHRGDFDSFAGSDFINFSQIERAAGPILKIQWRSIRFTEKSLGAGQSMETRETLIFQKQTPI